MIQQAIDDPALTAKRRLAWIGRVETLIHQIEEWAREQGWGVARSSKTIHERLIGEYSVPLLRVRLPVGEIHVIPVALNVVGAEGRVDLEAFPTLNRVKLIAQPGEWQVLTDSNVPLREPWTSAAFVRLANDLLA